MFKLMNKGYATEANAQKKLDMYCNVNNNELGRFFVVAQDGKYHPACILYSNMTRYMRICAEKGISVIGTC